MPSLCDDSQVPSLVIEVLYVEHCPNFPSGVGAGQQVAAEFAVDAEVRTTMITDQAAAE